MNSNQSQSEQIEEILFQLEHAQGEEETAENRRRVKRLNLRVPLRAIVLTQSNPTSVNIFSRNLSVGGMGFVSRRPFKVGERVAIPFHLPNHSPKLLLARIMFSRYLRNGLYEMGAEFQEAIGDPKGLAKVPLRWMFSPPTAAQMEEKTERRAGKGERAGKETGEGSAAAGGRESGEAAKAGEPEKAGT